MEVVCDESGYEGEKLIGSTTDLFAHASVRLDGAAAVRCVEELRDRIGSPATEYKANHLLRQRSRSTLEWLLGSSGPLAGHAHVHLIDKAFFVIDTLVDTLVDTAAGTDSAAIVYREGARTMGSVRWQAFLESANNLMRAKAPDDTVTVDEFFRALTGSPIVRESARMAETLRALRAARPRAAAYRGRIRDRPEPIPSLDPLFPAIIAAVTHWGRGGEPVFITHDRQKTLSEPRIRELKRILAERAAVSSNGRLAGLGFGKSSDDARIQIADILAGVVRRIAEDDRNGRGDVALTALLPSFVDAPQICPAV